MDDLQKSSPLVKLQDAARATAVMWPRLNGASPRRERAGDGAGAEAGGGNGAGAGDRDGALPRGCGAGTEERDGAGASSRRSGNGAGAAASPRRGRGCGRGPAGAEPGPPHAGSGNPAGAGAGNRGWSRGFTARVGGWHRQPRRGWSIPRREPGPPGEGTHRGGTGTTGAAAPKGTPHRWQREPGRGGCPRPWVAGGAAVPWLRGGAWGLPWDQGRAERARRQQRRGRAGPG